MVPSHTIVWSVLRSVATIIKTVRPNQVLDTVYDYFLAICDPERGILPDQVGCSPFLLYPALANLSTHHCWLLQWFLSHIFSVSFLDWEPESVPYNNGTSLFGEEVRYCYYRDFRHPPDSEAKYEHTKEYWHVLAAKLGMVYINLSWPILKSLFIANPLFVGSTTTPQ